jgi:hypothetical protein
LAGDFQEADDEMDSEYLGCISDFDGSVWTLQGINLLPGSFMTGQIKWAIYGIIAILIGGGWLVFANRRREGTPPTTGS